MQKKIKTLEDQFELINEHYVLSGDYQMEVDELEQQSFRMMAGDFTSFKEAIDMVQEAKVENIKKFSLELVKEVEKLREDVIRIRKAAQNPMILSEGILGDFILYFFKILFTLTICRHLIHIHTYIHSTYIHTFSWLELY